MKKELYTKRFFKGKRLEIVRVLVDELTQIEDTKFFTDEEFYRLVDKLFNIK